MWEVNLNSQGLCFCVSKLMSSVFHLGGGHPHQQRVAPGMLLAVIHQLRRGFGDLDALDAGLDAELLHQLAGLGDVVSGRHRLPSAPGPAMRILL